jgi:hypothetical protein
MSHLTQKTVEFFEIQDGVRRQPYAEIVNYDNLLPNHFNFEAQNHHLPPYNSVYPRS